VTLATPDPSEPHDKTACKRLLLICDYHSGLLDGILEILDHIGFAERVLITKQRDIKRRNLTGVIGLPLPLFGEQNPLRLTSIMSVMAYLIMATIVGTIVVLRRRLDLVTAIFAFPQGLAAVLIGRFTRRKVAVLTDGGDIDIFLRKSFIRHLIVACLRHADAVIALNRTKQNQLLSAGVESRVCPTFGIDISRFEYVPFDRKDKWMILYVGRLSVEKCPEVLIRACERLHREGVHVKALLVGDGPLRNQIMNTVARMKMTDTITLKGYLPHSQIQALYADAPIFVLPSSREGVSVSLLEAMSSGCVCIVSDIPDNREIVHSMCNGITFSLNDDGDLASKLRWATSQSSGLALMALNARNTVEDHYSLRTVGDGLDSVLSSLMRIRSSASRQRHV